MYDTLTITQAVIFCNTKKKVEWLANKMKEANFTVSFMNSNYFFCLKFKGDMNQKERDKIMEEFRKGNSRVLIATDIWGRGLDVQ